MMMKLEFVASIAEVIYPGDVKRQMDYLNGCVNTANNFTHPGYESSEYDRGRKLAKAYAEI